MSSEFEWHTYKKKPVKIKAKRMRKPFVVNTLEGKMNGDAGDWLVWGVAGERYPCKDSIFRKTYELAE